MSPPREKPEFRHVAVFASGLVIFLALALFNEIRGFDLWRNYALSGFFLGAPVVYTLWRLDMRLPQYIQAIIVTALLTHYIGGSLGSVPGQPYKMGLLGMHGINGAYHVFAWWDHLTHGLGIGASTMGIAYLFDVYQLRRGLGWSPAALWSVSVAAGLTAGVGVELYEYLGKTAFQTIDQGGYSNTMTDLQYNLFGAGLGAGIAVTVNRTMFKQRVSDQWSIAADEAPTGTWLANLPARMAGFLAFITIPAISAVFLAVDFIFVDVGTRDLELYDPALQTLVWATVFAIAAVPIATITHQKWTARGAE